jgi:hypothetical protein
MTGMSAVSIILRVTDDAPPGSSADRVVADHREAAVAGFQSSAFPLVQQSLDENGPELSRARREARRSRPLTARTVLRRWGKRESRVA